MSWSTGRVAKTSACMIVWPLGTDKIHVKPGHAPGLEPD